MARNTWIVGLALSAGLVAGCVERRYVVTSDPPGAAVYRNGQFIGATPVDDHFVYYGKYHYTLSKDGYETLQVDQKIPTPWYQFFPLDFVSEALVPTHIEDVHRFHYVLQPLQTPNVPALLDQAGKARADGQNVKAVAPPPPPESPAPPPPGAFMPPAH